MYLKIGRRQYLAIAFFACILLAISQSIPSTLTSFPHSNTNSKHSQQLLSSQVIDEQVLLVSEWIVVEAGEDLLIDNSTIVFIQDETAINVRDGGNLIIRDSILYSYPSCSWWISAESGAELLIEGSTLTGSGTEDQAGINIWCDDAIIEGSHISGFGGDNINVGDCTGVRIQNNVVTDSAWEGINFARTTDLIISGNQISDTGYCGIFGTGSENVIISENTISNTIYSGVCLDHTSASRVLSNNFSETFQDAISIEYCHAITVDENIVFSSYGGGVLSIWSTNLHIENNEIRETAYNGINLISHSQNISIVNNQFYDIYSCAVAAVSSSEILLFGNLMNNIRIHGFYGLDESENITLILNTVLACGNGFKFQDVRNVEVVGNFVNESVYHDIRVETCWTGLVYLNAFCSSDINVGLANTNLFDWDNGTVGNYWIDYEGEDEDQNGIGDSPYVVSYGYEDNYPLVSLDSINDFRSSFNISAYFWIPVENNTSTTTTTIINTNVSPMETLLIFSSSIQIFCVGILLIILKRRYAS